MYNHENIADTLPENKETVVKVILKELGISFKAVKDELLTGEEKHIVSALKQADLLKQGKLLHRSPSGTNGGYQTSFIYKPDCSARLTGRAGIPA